MTDRTSTRPVTAEHREAAREYVDSHAEQIRMAFGFVILRRYDMPQPTYGIHEITGLMAQRLGGKLMRVYLDSKTVGLVSPLIADEFTARIRYEQPLTSALPWRHMTPSLRRLVADASILPMEWKSADVLEGDFLDDRVRLTMSTPVLRFLSA